MHTPWALIWIKEHLLDNDAMTLRTLSQFVKDMHTVIAAPGYSYIPIFLHSYNMLQIQAIYDDFSQTTDHQLQNFLFHFYFFYFNMPI